MCRRFIPLTLEDIEEIIYGIPFDSHEDYRNSWLNRHDKTPAPDAYPKSMVPFIAMDEDGLKAKEMKWGYDVSCDSKPRFNARLETALGSRNNMWRDSLDRRRCVIPSRGFYEPHQSETFPSPKTGKPLARQYLFTPNDDTLLYMAGIYQAGCFALLTTEPNRSVRPVHNRMPIVLAMAEIIPWLEGSSAEAFAVHRPELSATPQ